MQPSHISNDQALTLAQCIPLRFQAIIWSCLESDLVKSAVFYAERYYALDSQDHDARHLYATALLRCGQPHSATALVDLPADSRCGGCSEIKAKCCTALARHRQAREALEDSLTDTPYTASAMKQVRVFPDDAVLHCRAGFAALKANLPDKAARSFRDALSLEPILWEAFEGLCAVGSFPEIDDVFPPRPPPVKQAPPDDWQANLASTSRTAASGPVATGAGFFTPETATMFRSFRMGPPAPRDSLATNDSSFHIAENSMMQAQARTSRGQITSPTLIPRPLSSADESGPASKKPRSVSRHHIPEKTKTLAGVETRSKKARARPALIISNFFSSSSGRGSQPTTTSSRTGKAEGVQTGGTTAARRSTRLLSGGGAKQTHVVKHPPQRERRRQHTHTRSRSNESDMEEEATPFGDPAYSPSPSSIAHSPRSEGSPVPSNTWTAAHEQAANESYAMAQADQYIYDLTRLFASALRALAMYDCSTCLEELNKIPELHQRSAWVMAMAGKAHYEMVDYIKENRAFTAARNLDPFRLWDMEVFSTLLWHLQRNVQLSFLAQELLSIDPRSPQAWIAVGNCFSLQKERSQALTCFRRAAQLDPMCAYAYTLSGHESIDDDLDKAVAFFQSALRVDARHYNAWYGLGTCYLRMSKFRLAEYHYRKAAEIHPNNAVLLGCVGMALERRGDSNGAFALYDEAVRLSPDNALVRYRRAKILIAMRNYRAAAEDLEHLRDSSPEESNVVFQLARVYRLMGNETKSAQMLAIARDMSPKSLNKIKKLLETTKDEMGDDEMDEG